MRAALAAALAGATLAGADQCASYTSCATCAAVNGCGWCSVAVKFEDGTTGPQCASPADSSKKFTCPGLYSTSQCLEGWNCDQASGTCRKALPGQGVDRDRCENSCVVGPIQDVYGCKNGTKTCVVVPPGTPGSASREQCSNNCWTPAAKVYACGKSQKCEEVPPGTAGSSSQTVCEARGCDSGDYWCDPVGLTCSQQPGKGAKSKARCEADCKEQNDPCQQHYTCSDCLAAGPECGWCSTNVTYANGRNGTRCAGVRKDILPFQCPGEYSNTACTAPAPPTPTPAPAPGPGPLPPRVNCPKGSTVLLQYNCKDSSCDGCTFVDGQAVECVEPTCTLYCSGQCQSVPAFGTSFMWTCNDPQSTGHWTNATLVHYTKMTDCTGPVNPAGSYGGGTFPVDACAEPSGPNLPHKFNTFRCVPCGKACDWH
eukprot:TRINITY_DN61240_c0_g1_i1.p1 TRINITY_DN61240_c0_g1~~TRINITY_DN61240_c0_g1_i1.p1  ORF type:complete len:455 (+),score=140.05 TRINITY_DN61240_c0_g1_i1:86-1366(+)